MRSIGLRCKQRRGRWPHDDFSVQRWYVVKGVWREKNTGQVAKSDDTRLCVLQHIGNKSRLLVVGVIEGGGAKPFFVYICIVEGQTRRTRLICLCGRPVDPELAVIDGVVCDSYVRTTALSLRSRRLLKPGKYTRFSCWHVQDQDVVALFRFGI
ncbi:unnamed protein product [Ectocarpus fasciculatus]